MLQFFSVVAAYNYFRKRVKITWQIPLLIVAIQSFFFSLNFQFLLFAVGLISFLYQLPFKSKIGFRYYPYLKPFVIGLCWAVVVITPTIFYQSFDNSVLFFLILKFLEISALCLANDLLHIPKDKVNGVKTFPIAYGVDVSKISVLILSFFQILFPLVLLLKDDSINRVDLKMGLFLMSMIFSYLLIIASVILIHYKKNKGVEYFLDILIGLEALFFLILNYKLIGF
ncbi:MAG: UbiA prenyltransferase family [Bacteroidota bacterium]